MIEEGITSFPADVAFSAADVCSKLGITAPAIGDRFEFTANTLLKSGMLVPGWTELMGFNNSWFSGWVMEGGRAYASRVLYSAFAPFIAEHYQGIVACDEDGNGYSVEVTPLPAGDFPETLPPGISEDMLYGVLIDGIWDTGCKLKVWVNTAEMSLIIPNQIVNPAWDGYDGTARPLEFRGVVGEVDTVNEQFIFTAGVNMVGLGGWSGIPYMIQF